MSSRMNGCCKSTSMDTSSGNKFSHDYYFITLTKTLNRTSASIPYGRAILCTRGSQSTGLQAFLTESISVVPEAASLQTCKHSLREGYPLYRRQLVCRSASIPYGRAIRCTKGSQSTGLQAFLTEEPFVVPEAASLQVCKHSLRKVYPFYQRQPVCRSASIPYGRAIRCTRGRQSAGLQAFLTEGLSVVPEAASLQVGSGSSGSPQGSATSVTPACSA